MTSIYSFYLRPLAIRKKKKQDIKTRSRALILSSQSENFHVIVLVVFERLCSGDIETCYGLFGIGMDFVNEDHVLMSWIFQSDINTKKV
jgi:hypothetical protein